MSIIFSDDFDAGFTDSNGLPARDPSKWLEWADGTELLQDDGSWELDPQGQLGAGFASTVGYGLVFRGGSGAVRQATTKSLSTITRGGTISFNMIFGDDNNGGEDPDQLSGISEGIYLSYSIDGGINYTDIVHYLTTRDLNSGTNPDATYPGDATPNPYTSTPVTWTTFTVPIPTLAIGESDVRFKWQQKKYSTTRDYYDSWGIDKVSIELTNTAPSATSSTADSISGFTFKDGIIEFGNGTDLVFNLKDVRLRMMGGNDYIEIIGGINNFANGNDGSDQIVLKAGQGTYQGGSGGDTFAVFGASKNYINGDKGQDKITLNAGLSKALGGDDNDSIEVLGATTGSLVNGNNGNDFITGLVAGVTYRGGKDNDVLEVSQGDVWGDLGVDTFRGVSGDGYALIQDYTVGEDRIQGIAGGSFTETADGLAYGVGSDQMFILVDITDASQVTVI